MSEWDRCRPLLEAALDGTHTMEDVAHEIREGRAQFWPFERAAVVTQVLDHPRKRVLRIWLAGGELDDIRRASAHLPDVARAYGCDSIEIEGRKGWGRVLDGFEMERVVYSKDIDL